MRYTVICLWKVYERSKSWQVFTFSGFNDVCQSSEVVHATTAPTETVLLICNNVMFFCPICDALVQNRAVQLIDGWSQSYPTIVKRYPWIAIWAFGYGIDDASRPHNRYPPLLKALIKQPVHISYGCRVTKQLHKYIPSHPTALPFLARTSAWKTSSLEIHSSRSFSVCIPVYMVYCKNAHQCAE